MVDSAEGEIPQMVDPQKEPRVDGESQQHSPTFMVATHTVSKVLEDDDLLWEIMLRLGLPTFLVHAALVCKRWLGHASDRKFLSRFCKLNPPRLLGYYVTEESIFYGRPSTHFVQMLPQPPELKAIICRVESYDFGEVDIINCQNGSILTRSYGGNVLTVHRPLCPERSMDCLPPLPRDQDTKLMIARILSTQQGGKSSYLYLLVESTKEVVKSTASANMSQDGKLSLNTRTSVYMLQDGVWCMRTSFTCELLQLDSGWGRWPVLVGSKIYMWTIYGDELMVLDLKSSTFSKIQLPQEVEGGQFDNTTILSPAYDASSVYLIDVVDFHLRIWFHNNKEDNWFKTLELYLQLEDEDEDEEEDEDEDANVMQILQVGDDCRFVFLKMGESVFYLDMDIKPMTLHTVHEYNDDWGLVSVDPLMMIWPPAFPALKEGSASVASLRSHVSQRRSVRSMAKAKGAEEKEVLFEAEEDNISSVRVLVQEGSSADTAAFEFQAPPVNSAKRKRKKEEQSMVNMSSRMRTCSQSQLDGSRMRTRSQSKLDGSRMSTRSQSQLEGYRAAPIQALVPRTRKKSKTTKKSNCAGDSKH